MHNTLSESETQALSTESSQQIASLERRAKEREAKRVSEIRSYANGYQITGGGFRDIPVNNWRWYDVAAPEFRSAVQKKFLAFALTYTGYCSAALLGSTGAGKTSSVLGALKRLRLDAEREAMSTPHLEAASNPMLRKLRDLRWYTGSQLALARKAWPLGKGEAPTIEHAMDAPILILDELGFEVFDTAFADVIHQRYSRQKPTIVTSGLTVEKFRERYGDAIWRKLTTGGVTVEGFAL